MSRSLKLFVTLSVLLNLLLLGVVFGYVGQGMFGNNYVRHLSMRELVAVLPQDKQQMFAETVQKSEQDIKQLKDKLYAERKKAAELLNAKPFSKEAYAAEAKAVMQLRSQIFYSMTGTLSDIADRVSDEDRAKMTQALLENQKRQQAAGQ
jgi:uncharacterized membrane protein